MPDDVLELVGRTGGVVMVTFVPWFLAPAGAAANQAEWEVERRLRAEHPDAPEWVRAAMERYDEEQPVPECSVGDVADHVDHIRDVAGIDHVGVGSDFAGAAGLPKGLEDFSRYQVLFAELADRGYADEELSKIAGRNVLRVMGAAEDTAARLRDDARG